jgi:serine phosphatase RsbU (regulator of sigma subunit)
VLDFEDPPRRVPVGDRLLVGRTDDCGLQLDDPGASRHHLEVVRKGDAFRSRDLESTNGTLHNGRKTAGGALARGDLLQIGDTVLRFDTAAEPSEPTAMVRETILPGEGTTMALPKGDRATELLRAVYAVGNAIASEFDPCRLVDRVLETTLEAIDGQRGGLFFRGEGGGDLCPCPACGRVHMIERGTLRAAGEDEIRISRSVARHVLQGGDSVLYEDVGQPGGPDASESMQGLQLRSVLCVPVRGKGGVLGILYMDSDRPGRKYTREHMLLSAAVGNSAGVALENAALHREILDKQRTDQEIEFAAAIQQGFLVQRWPETDARFAVYGQTRPARVVGGDFYDFVQTGPDRAAFAVGDVSGKGVPAALAMAQILAAFRACARASSSPASVLGAVNAGVAEHVSRGMFCTMTCVTVDLGSGEGLCANAGHPRAFRLRGGAVDLLADASGPPVGIAAETSWHDEPFALAPGDRVLLYTDGFIEARAGGGRTAEAYGIERLHAAAAAAGATTPEGLVGALNEAVGAWCAPAAPHDDCTVIAFQYAGRR